MSAKTMGQVWEKDLPFNKAWVLMAYADHADHDGRNCFPRLGIIAWKTGYSIPSVKRLVAELRKEGILIRDGFTMFGVVKYRIVLDHVPDKPKYSEPGIGRPKGALDNEPRGPREAAESRYQKTPYQFDTDYFDTHNRHVPNKEESSTNVPLTSSSNPSSFNSNSLFDEFDDEWSTPAANNHGGDL